MPPAEKAALNIEMKEYFRKHGIESFISGEIFDLADDTRVFADHLALLCLQSILGEGSGKVSKFLANCTNDFGGHTQLLEIFGTGLEPFIKRHL